MYYYYYVYVYALSTSTAFIVFCASYFNFLFRSFYFLFFFLLSRVVVIDYIFVPCEQHTNRLSFVWKEIFQRYTERSQA